MNMPNGDPIVVQPTATQSTGVTPTGAPSGSVSLESIQQIVDQALARQAEAHQQQIAEIRSEVSKGGMTRDYVPPISVLPEHAAGPGKVVAPTWSYAEQLAMLAAEPVRESDTLAAPAE